MDTSSSRPSSSRPSPSRPSPSQTQTQPDGHQLAGHQPDGPALVGHPTSIRLLRVQLPLINPHRTAHGSEFLRDVVLIEVTDADGTSGWGDCSTLSTSGYVTETTDQAWRALVDVIGPAALRSGSGGVGAHSGAAPAGAAAMTDAFLDLWLRRQGISLTTHLGGEIKPLERCGVVAGVGLDNEQLIARAVAVAAGGVSMIKLKITPNHDPAVVADVIDAVNPLPVAADANGSFADPEQLRWVDELGLAYIEQPFPAGSTAEQLGDWAAQLATPVALDESITKPGDVAEMAAAGAARIVSLKPLRTGGIEAAVAAGREAADAGLGVFVGGMLETGIGRAGALAVASCFERTLPTDLGPSSSYFNVDVCDPIECDADGKISAPSGPGLGRTPRPDVLEQVVVDKVLLRR